MVELLIAFGLRTKLFPNIVFLASPVPDKILDTFLPYYTI